MAGSTHEGTTGHNGTDGLIGAPIRRVEDLRLMTGAGRYVDDIQLPGLLHLVVLRSPYPKARIISIDASAAREMPGVVAVLTGADIDFNITAAQMIPGMKVPPHPILAKDAVYAVGVPVAAVVAETTAQAQDAANAIDVEYEALPSIANAEAALEPNAPIARDELDTNVCYVA
jgi:carbon-monoxide dehydrogenase large subunit